MDRSSLLWWHLNILTKERYDAILQVFESLEEAATHINAEFLAGLGCRGDFIENTLLRLEEFDLAREEALLQKTGVRVLMLGDAAYPSRLSQIGDPPVFLSHKGDLSILDQPCIALVGTRAMSRYGRRVTEEFTPALVRAGMVTVSGLALGIDAAVAEETLRAGGRTAAVLGHGLGQIYPKANKELADKIVNTGGLILSEYPLSMQPERRTFPARNRLIAGLSLGTIVLEAPEGSGAIITAELALEYAREVFAVPGDIFDPNYAGSNALIAAGRARLVSSAAEALREIGIAAPSGEEKPSAYQPQNGDEKQVLGVLTTMPQHTDDIVERSGLPAARAGAALTMMELMGGAKNKGGGLWVRA